MIKVLFLCLRNDCLSQIAEGLLNKIRNADFKAYSAGFYPTHIPPAVKKQMQNMLVDPENHYPKSVLEFSEQELDYVIWVGGKMPQGTFPFVQGKRAKLYIWRTELPEVNPMDLTFAKELNREAQVLLTRMHLFVLSHHQELELAGAH